MENQADRMKGYRFIAPRHVDLQATHLSQPSNADEGKTKRASMACLECKRRRTKCSTDLPCSECAIHDRECIYDQSADKRRREHLLSTKTQLETTEAGLAFYYKLLEDLLQSLRLASKDQLDQLVQVIQDTGRNSRLEDQGRYQSITVAVDSILAESEDAPGSDVDDDQNLMS